MTQEEMDLAKLDDDDDDDSDYEYHGGDASLYDSGFDATDEIKYLRDTLTGLSTQDPQALENIMS